MNGFVSKLRDIDSIVIPGEMLNVSIDEQRVEDELRLLSMRYAKESPAASVINGDLVRCRADKDSYPDGRTILIFPGAGIPGAEEAEKAALDKAVGDVFTADLAGKSAVLTVEGITRRTPVEVNDDLISGMGVNGVATVNQYRSYIREKALKDQRMEQSKAITRYIVDELEAGSEYSYDEAEMDAHVQASTAEYLAQCPEGSFIMPSDEIRESIISQSKQGWIAEAFCRSRGIEPDMAAIQEEADQMLEMMTLMGGPAPDRAELVAMARQNECFNALFEYINNIIEREMGGSNGNNRA